MKNLDLFGAAFVSQPDEGMVLPRFNGYLIKGDEAMPTMVAPTLIKLRRL